MGGLGAGAIIGGATERAMGVRRLSGATGGEGGAIRVRRPETKTGRRDGDAAPP
jgi:hypothetical protein